MVGAVNPRDVRRVRGYPAGMAEAADDDTKRKFREALERKKAKSSGSGQHKDGGTKQPRVHGPVEQRREFRRKSG
jgi:Family of unknown function (DUF5302)